MSLAGDSLTPHPREETFVRYWDNALTPEELRELNAALAVDAATREAFQQFCLQVLVIGEHFAVEKVRPRPAPPRRRVRTAALVGLLLVGALAVALFRKPAGDAVATLADVTGNVWVADGEGGGVPARLRQPIRSGQTVSLTGIDDAAEVRFRDGTRLLLKGDTAIQVTDDGQKRVRVVRGDLAADVRPQPPGRPMILTTPEAEVQVVGTLLSISGSKRKTDVAVVKGEVVVTQLSDQKSVTLHAGEFARAGVGKVFLQKRRDLPDEYALDFENPPPDWGSGERVVEGLPPGSRAAMRAALFHGGYADGHHVISSQNVWTAGMFDLHEDSWLHCRFRLDVPGFFHVLLVARGADPTRKAVVFEVPHFWRHRAAGVWHEVSVPLGQSKRVGNPQRDLRLPLVVYKVIISSQVEDRGLTVDRVWVTRNPVPARPPDPADED